MEIIKNFLKKLVKSYPIYFWRVLTFWNHSLVASCNAVGASFPNPIRVGLLRIGFFLSLLHAKMHLLAASLHHVYWHVPITYSDAAGTGGKGGPLNYFVDQLTLLQPGEGRLFPTITMYWPPKLCHLPASLSLINSSLFLIFRNDILGLYFGMI